MKRRNEGKKHLENTEDLQEYICIPKCKLYETYCFPMACLPAACYKHVDEKQSVETAAKQIHYEIYGKGISHGRLRLGKRVAERMAMNVASAIRNLRDVKNSKEFHEEYERKIYHNLENSFEFAEIFWNELHLANYEPEMLDFHGKGVAQKIINLANDTRHISIHHVETNINRFYNKYVLKKR